MRAQFSQCMGVSEDQKEEAEMWLAVAADAGHVFAMYRLGAGFLGNTLEARQYLERAWQAGEVEAASQLARLYAEPPADQAELGNRILAYSYMYLYKALVDAYSAGVAYQEGQAFQSLMTMVAEATERYRLALSPYEEYLAVETMKDLLRANSNCCLATAIVAGAYSTVDRTHR